MVLSWNSFCICDTCMDGGCRCSSPEVCVVFAAGISLPCSFSVYSLSSLAGFKLPV